MADSTTAATNAVSKAATSPATKAAITRTANEAVAKAVADQALPLVTETAELAMEIPSKVVLNQKLVVVASVLAGAALGAGALYGAYKLRERKLKAKVENAVAETVTAIQTPPTTGKGTQKP